MAEGSPKPLDGALREELSRIEAAGLLRKLKALGGPQGPRVEVDGRAVANFSSNDYLGLSAHPALKEAATEEWGRGGFGAGASRLVCGTLRGHSDLEEAIADFKGTGAALCFGSGYAAAVGTIAALCGKDGVVVLDKLSHACLVDGARLSGAAIRVFPHNDTAKLDSHLRWAAKAKPGCRVLVVAESIYSMDGDAAPLREIVEIKERHGAWLFLDEAHAVGVAGRGGRGLADAAGVADRIEIQMGTLGKALGAHGAYIAGSPVLRDFLVNRARSFVFSTAPPPPVAAAARKAVEIVRSAEGDGLRGRLKSNVARFCQTLGISRPAAAIVPLLAGPEAAAVEAGARLLEAGFFVPAIRYPTVARGAARLRVTLTATQSAEDIDALGAALGELADLLPGARGAASQL